MKIKIASLAVSLATIVAVLIGSAGAYAASSGTGNGQRVSPVRSDLTISPGTSQSVLVSVQNVTAAPQTLEAVINDFVAGNNENGQPQLILKPGGAEPSTGLKQFIAPISNFTLAPGATQQVRVTITIPKGTPGGGYFGAVRFVPASSAGGSGVNVNLTASVGSLILVKVPGNLTENMVLASFDIRSDPQASSGTSFSITNKGLYAVARFQNKGNVQEEPFGKVQVLRSGKVLQSTEVNNTDPPGNVLPDSIRRFSVKLTKLPSWGKVTVNGNFGYGSNGQLLSASTTLYIVPLGLIVGLLVIIVLIVAAIIGLPKAVRAYNRRILRGAGRR